MSAIQDQSRLAFEKLHRSKTALLDMRDRYVTIGRSAARFGMSDVEAEALAFVRDANRRIDELDRTIKNLLASLPAEPDC